MGNFHPVVSNASESDPLTEVVVSTSGPSTSAIIERSIPLISKVFFLEK